MFNSHSAIDHFEIIAVSKFIEYPNTMMIRRLAFALFLGFVGPAQAGINLTATDAWSPQAPPGRMMAGFMHIENHGSDAIILTHAESDQFGRIEIHSMRMDDGVMRMRKLDALEVPSGESVELRPGGLHLMLMQPQGRFELGDRFELELIDSADNRWPVTLEVRERRR